MAKKKPKSREFEELVARIEGHLAPLGAMVKSPDRLKAKAGKRKREVDASIRHRVGSGEVLITIECRERSRLQDVTWIEQIAGKRDLVGASLTIAVSSKGFSKDAIEAARFHDVQLRIIQEIKDEDIEKWTDGILVEKRVAQLKIQNMGIQYFEPGEPSPALSGAFLELWHREGIEAKIFHDHRTGVLISLNEVIARATPQRQVHVMSEGSRVRVTIPAGERVTFGADPLTALLVDAPADGTTVKQLVRITATRGDYAIESVAGLKDVAQIMVEVDASQTRERLPASRLLHYTDEKGPLGKVVEHEVKLGPSQQKLIMTRYDPIAREEMREEKQQARKRERQNKKRNRK